jgi:hypothetical protein
LIAVGAPGVLFVEDEVVEGGYEENGFGGGEGGDAVDYLGGGGHLCEGLVLLLFWCFLLVFGCGGGGCWCWKVGDVELDEVIPLVNSRAPSEG